MDDKATVFSLSEDPYSHLLSGVPQGSVLGPLLFLIYIDDVSSLQLSENSVLNLYADDMLLYKQIKCSEVANGH